MENKDQKAQLIENASTFARAAVPITFLAITGIITLAVSLTNLSIRGSKNLLSSSGVPLAWSKSAPEASGVSAGTSAEVVSYDDSFVQYNSYIKNNNPTSYFVTHLSSYLTSEKGANTGFVPLTSSAIEYTYTPEKADSWQLLSISAPANNANGFKLKDRLYLGNAGTPSDTIYFRYGVSTGGVSADNLTEKTAFLVSKDGDSEEGLSVAATELAYNLDENDSSVIAVSDENSAAPIDDASAAATEVLGAVSYISDTEIISGTLRNSSVAGASLASLLPSQALLVLLISVLAATLIIYLPLRRRATKTVSQPQEPQQL